MIEVKSKPCKGIGKCHGIKGCGKPSTKRKFGLCPACLWEWMCLNDNGKVWRETQFIPKVKRKTEKEKKKRNREQREAMKSIARLIQEARVPFQKWIRLRDANKACISCNQTGADIFDAGHFYKSEVYRGMIFNPSNCHSQCRACNRYMNGNESNYRLGLINRYGEEFVKKLDEEAIANRDYRWSREEISEIKKKYQKLVKDFFK